jgi:hypothetical protein
VGALMPARQWQPVADYDFALGFAGEVEHAHPMQMRMRETQFRLGLDKSAMSSRDNGSIMTPAGSRTLSLRTMRRSVDWPSDQYW